MVELVNVPKPKSSYCFPLDITDERRQFTERRERRAKELGISLYILGADPDKNDELQKLEDYIMENFIDMDLDVPENIKEKYLSLKEKLKSGDSQP
jgi:hypothetical protein